MTKVLEHLKRILNSILPSTEKEKDLLWNFFVYTLTILLPIMVVTLSFFVMALRTK